MTQQEQLYLDNFSSLIEQLNPIGVDISLDDVVLIKDRSHNTAKMATVANIISFVGGVSGTIGDANRIVKYLGVTQTESILLEVIDGITIDAGKYIVSTDTNKAIDTNGRILYDGNDDLSISWNNRLLIDDFSQLAVNWSIRSLYDETGGVKTLDWNGCSLYDGTNDLSISWNNRQLFDNVGTETLDWENLTLSDANALSINWSGRQAFDDSGVMSIDWNNRISRDSLGAASVNWGTRKLLNNTEFETVDWELGTLTNANAIAINWLNHLLFDDSCVTSVNFTNRYLVNNVGGLAVRWDVVGEVLFNSTILANIGIDVTATVGADVLNIGTSNADVINIGRIGATVNILGAVLNENVTNTYVADKLITLNDGGGIASGIGVGFEIEEDNVITGYFKTNGTRDGYTIKTPAISFELDFKLSILSANRTLHVPNETGLIAIADGNTIFINGSTWQGVAIADAYIASAAAWNALVSNATHTGEVTGATVLTLNKTGITNKTNVTAAVGDSILISDLSDTDNLKKVTIQSILDLTISSLKTKTITKVLGDFLGTPLKATVTFATPFVDADYSISIVGTDSRSWSFESKLAGSFVINANSNTALTGDVTIIATKTGEN